MPKNNLNKRCIAQRVGIYAYVLRIAIFIFEMSRFRENKKKLNFMQNRN
jgi:hypothetical protein